MPVYHCMYLEYTLGTAQTNFTSKHYYLVCYNCYVKTGATRGTNNNSITASNTPCLNHGASSLDVISVMVFLRFRQISAPRRTLLQWSAEPRRRSTKFTFRKLVGPMPHDLAVDRIVLLLCPVTPHRSGDC